MCLAFIQKVEGDIWTESATKSRRYSDRRKVEGDIWTESNEMPKATF